MVLSKLLRIGGLASLVVVATITYLGYRLYTALKEHGEFEFGWAVSDPGPEEP